MNILARLSRLSAADRRVVAESLLHLIIVRASLILLPLRTVQERYAGAFPGVTPASRLRHIDPQRLVRLVHLVARLVPGAHCLPRALVAQLLLRRRGLDPVLRFGVRKDAGRLDAHAWLELDGAPLLESHETLRDYTPFTPNPGAKP